MRCASVSLAFIFFIFLLWPAYGTEYRSVGRSGYTLPTHTPQPEMKKPEAKKPESPKVPKQQAGKKESPEVPKPASKSESAPVDEAPKPDSPAPAKSEAKIQLFNTVEIKKPLKAIPGWLDVLSRNSREPIFEAPTPLFDSQAHIGKKQTWESMKKKAQAMSKMDQLRLVNKYWNQWPYIEDSKNWGVQDYWEIPAQFLDRSGDCEDYAIAKYFTLKELGFDPSLMRIAVVKDTIRMLAHAVLVVYLDGNAYVLDNLSNVVLPHKRLTNYQPQYTINESGLWGHMKKARQRSEK